MCGIAGVIGWNILNHLQAPTLRAMQDSLHKRVSNQNPLQDSFQNLFQSSYQKQEIFSAKQATLMHAQLRALENDRQPMTISHKGAEYTIVFDGIIYNKIELKLQLTGIGHKFNGHSEAEILLHAYAEWGEGCVTKLDGIFSFAVWENQRQRLFIARDRIGVKHLFYTQKNGVFLFASDLPTLLIHPLAESEINIESIAEIIILGPGRTPGYGVFHGIEEIKPAFFGFYEKNELITRRYWTLEDKHHTDNFTQTVEKVRGMITESIERQFMSNNLPVGTFLSGGLNSSIISATVARFYRDNWDEFYTFSVGYKGDNDIDGNALYDKTCNINYIEKMSDYLRVGTRHRHILLDTNELVEALYTAVDIRGLPGMADMDASLLLFYKAVKEHVDIVLSGEYADVIFGGYPWDFCYKESAEVGTFPWAKNTSFRAGFLKPEFAVNWERYIDERYCGTIEEASILPDTPLQERKIKEMTNLNMQLFMQTILEWQELMSIYNGLEIRIPFCDFKLLEYVYPIPSEIKNYQNRENGLLRHAMEGLLPNEILQRKKIPFPKIRSPAYKESVSNKLNDIIADPNAPILQFVRKEALESLITSERNELTASTWYGHLMDIPQIIAYFLQINYWMVKFNVKIVRNRA